MGTMLSPDALTTLNFPIGDIALFALYFIIGAYAIFSAVFYYHWHTYGTDAKITNLTLGLYFGITLPLLIIMTLMAITL